MASVATIVLLITGWGSAMASAVQSVVVTNTTSNPVPVTPTGTVPVHEQGTAKVAEQNLDSNGNVKVHEQGTANVNVTNSALPVSGSVGITGTPSVSITGTPSVNVTNSNLSVTSGDRTQIIASGENTVPASQSVVLGGGTIDISAYKTVTVYWAVFSVSPASERIQAFTGDGHGHFFEPCGIGADCPLSSANSHYTFDPAPPNIQLTWGNLDTSTDATLDWMLVGRFN